MSHLGYLYSGRLDETKVFRLADWKGFTMTPSECHISSDSTAAPSFNVAAGGWKADRTSF